MSEHDSTQELLDALEPEIDHLLEAERGERPLPDGMEERIGIRLELATSTAPPPVQPVRTWPTHALAAAAGAAAALLAVRMLAPPREDPVAQGSSAPIVAVDASVQISASPDPPSTLVDAGASYGVDIAALPRAKMALPSLRSSPPPDAGPPRDPVDNPDDALAIEARLVDTARAALARRDFDGAVAATEQHARQMPGGRLAEEREAIAVQALVGARRMDEARARATSFYARWPNGLSRPLVDAALRSIP